MSLSFADLHHGDRPLVLPNAWDVASALALAAAGFPAVGTTSLGVAAGHGLPDASGLARAEIVALAQRLRGLPCHVSVDIEDGFSADPGEVADLVAGLGSAGVNLEDGRRGGLADPAAQALTISAVKARTPQVFVNARVDTYWLGIDADRRSTIARSRQYEDAGADGIFVPGRLDAGDIEALASAVRLPLNVLATDLYSLDALGDLGVRRVSTGSLLYRLALGAAVEGAASVRDGRPLPGGAPTYADVQALVAGSPLATGPGGTL